jgi:hypothetical protein
MRESRNRMKREYVESGADLDGTLEITASR